MPYLGWVRIFRIQPNQKLKEEEFMDITFELERLCKICTKHFDELDIHHTGKIKILTIEIESHTIWGGNGDEDTTRTYYISKSGWLVHEMTEQSGMYVKGNGIIEQEQRQTTSAAIAADIEQHQRTIWGADSLSQLYEKVKEKFESEFREYGEGPTV